MKLGKIIGILCALSILTLTALQSKAVQGLQISLECSNVVLSWPTIDGEGDTYMIRRKADLTTNSQWVIIQDFYSEASGTNVTTYTDVGVVTNAVCDGGGGFGGMAITRGSLSRRISAADLPSNPIPPPPLPPGLVITTNGDGTVTASCDPSLASSQMSSRLHADGLTPPGGFPFITNGTPDITNEPVAGPFYEVVRDGTQLYGVINNQIVSGILSLPCEVANSGGQLTTLTIEDYGIPISTTYHTALF